MKTTVDISDPLFNELKRAAAQERTTLRRLIEAALRAFLKERKRPQGPFKLKDGSVPGRGTAPGVREGDWSRIREAIYEGRGG